MDLVDSRPSIAIAGLRLAVECRSQHRYEMMADAYERADEHAAKEVALRSAIELTESPRERQRLSSKLSRLSRFTCG